MTVADHVSPMTGISCGRSAMACSNFASKTMVGDLSVSECFRRQEQRQYWVPMRRLRPDKTRKCPACGSMVLERDTLQGWQIACHTRKPRGGGGTCEVGVQDPKAGNLWRFMQVRNDLEDR